MNHGSTFLMSNVLQSSLSLLVLDSCASKKISELISASCSFGAGFKYLSYPVDCIHFRRDHSPLRTQRYRVLKRFTMSNIYLSEPPTSGKVLIHTNFGDIDVELWAKECPLACRNFIQHCVDGYYNNNIFHRVIKDFMAQTGDPTNTGKGGESIWGRPFKDEIHGRIKFNHRGQVRTGDTQYSCAHYLETLTSSMQPM